MPIAANLMGRLGNQMFQIAAAHSLAIDNGDYAVFPVIPQGTIPQAHEQLFYVSSILSNVTYGYEFSWIKSRYDEPTFEYSQIPYHEDLLISGYFQSEKYFAHNASAIRDLFSVTPYIENQLKKYANICNDEHVALHVRRGDYLQPQNAGHTNLGQKTQYYATAIREFPDKKRVIFSDDIDWCKSAWGENNVFIENENDVVEMFLFSRIPNKIIANSSFSWWGAWLGDNNNNASVVAPEKWFGEKNSHLSTATIIPERWKRI